MHAAYPVEQDDEIIADRTDKVQFANLNFFSILGPGSIGGVCHHPDIGHDIALAGPSWATSGSDEYSGERNIMPYVWVMANPTYGTGA